MNTKNDNAGSLRRMVRRWWHTWRYRVNLRDFVTARSIFERNRNRYEGGRSSDAKLRVLAVIERYREDAEYHRRKIEAPNDKLCDGRDEKQ